MFMKRQIVGKEEIRETNETESLNHLVLLLEFPRLGSPNPPTVSSLDQRRWFILVNFRKKTTNNRFLTAVISHSIGISFAMIDPENYQ
jgi:hypothetical protein